MSTISKEKTVIRSNETGLVKGVFLSFETISEIESALKKSSPPQQPPQSYVQ